VSEAVGEGGLAVSGLAALRAELHDLVRQAMQLREFLQVRRLDVIAPDDTNLVLGLSACSSLTSV